VQSSPVNVFARRLNSLITCASNYHARVSAMLVTLSSPAYRRIYIPHPRPLNHNTFCSLHSMSSSTYQIVYIEADEEVNGAWGRWSVFGSDKIFHNLDEANAVARGQVILYKKPTHIAVLLDEENGREEWVSKDSNARVRLRAAVKRVSGTAEETRTTTAGDVPSYNTPRHYPHLPRETRSAEKPTGDKAVANVLRRSAS